jgi:hypothetical protein
MHNRTGVSVRQSVALAALKRCFQLPDPLWVGLIWVRHNALSAECPRNAQALFLRALFVFFGWMVGTDCYARAHRMVA